MVELLGRSLALRLDAFELGALRGRLMGNPGLWDDLAQFALNEGLALALEQSLRSRGLLVSELLPPDSGLVGPDRWLMTCAAGLAERRRGLAGHLIEIIARLNRAGIEPIIIKGAQSLLTGDPPWRYMRDFDLLIPEKAEDAQNDLIAMGFSVPEEEAHRHRRHHLPPLIRKDFPGFIEIHRRPGNQYVRSLLPTRELVAESKLQRRGEIRYRLLPQPLHILFSLVHHHIGHAGDARGTITLKGLYEFAWEVERMTDVERQALQRRANRNPRLASALDTWVAAAAALYRMPVAPPLEIRPDATERWEATLARHDQPRPWYKYPGYPEEIRMGLADHRVRAAAFGDYLPGRVWTRLKVMRSFLPRFTK